MLFESHGRMERQLLSAVLSLSEERLRRALPYVMQRVEPDHFRDPCNHAIYEAIRMLASDGKPVNVATVIEELRRGGELARVGGVAAVASLDADVKAANSYEYLVECVLRNSAVATVHDIGELITAQAEQADADPVQIAGAVLPLFASIAVTNDDGGDSAARYAEELAERLEKRAARPCVPTGYPSFDRLLNGGLSRKGLHVIAARPSMGKTALMLNLAWNAARTGKRVLVFSMEQSEAAVRDRLVALVAKVPLPYIVEPSTIALDAYEETRRKLLDAAREIGETSLAIVEGAQTVEQVTGRVMYEKETSGLDLVCADYLGLFKIPGKASRTHELGAVAKYLKDSAVRNDVAFVLLCQLSRDVEKRAAADRVPTLADLRDSGEIEECADTASTLFRSDYYEPGADSALQLHLRKNRDGKLGEVRFDFWKSRMLVEEKKPDGAAQFGGRELTRTESRAADQLALMGGE